MDDKFTTQEGTVLTLAKVNKMSLQDILFKMGYRGLVATDADKEKTLRDWYEELSEPERRNVMDAMSQLLNLCAMFGVTNDPPETALVEMHALGFPITSKRLARMHWIRHILLRDETEAGRFWAAVVSYSLGMDDNSAV